MMTTMMMKTTRTPTMKSAIATISKVDEDHEARVLGIEPQLYHFSEPIK